MIVLNLLVKGERLLGWFNAQCLKLHKRKLLFSIKIGKLHKGMLWVSGIQMIKHKTS